MLDLRAVVEHIGLERFALFGALHHGPVAIAYAALEPQRVSHLILWCSWARASDFYESPEAQTLASLRDKDWETYTETIAQAFTGWSGGGEARRLAQRLRDDITREALQASAIAASHFDVTSLLPEVKSPTLVLHPRQSRLVDVKLARTLASGVTGARLAMVEGSSLIPIGEEANAVLTAVDQFLGQGEEAASGAGPLGTEDVHTLLFTDVEGSTRPSPTVSVTRRRATCCGSTSAQSGRR